MDLIKNLKEERNKEKKCIYLILKYLAQVQVKRIYAQLGHSSLYKFLIKELNYSEGEASLRIGALRIMMKSPALSEKLKTGQINLTMASKLGDALLKKERELGKNLPEKDIQALLEKIQHKSTRQGVKIIYDDLLIDRPKIKKIELNEKISLKFERVRGLYGDIGDLELLEILLDEKIHSYVAKNNVTLVSKNSRYIPLMVKEVAFKKAEHRCQYLAANGQRCQERRSLQLDHRIPYSRGGTNDIKNIRVLCSSHNQYERVRILGGR